MVDSGNIWSTDEPRHCDLCLLAGYNNARAILDDLVAIGPLVFERFTAKKEGTLWYYAELAKIFSAANAPMAKELAATVQKIIELAV